MARKKTTRKKAAPGDPVTVIKHATKRKNLPPAGLEAQGRIEDRPKIRYEYNPHLPPVLRSADDAGAADQLPELLQTARQRPLSDDEAKILAEALRRHEPWLEWSGKREKPWFEVDPVALHIHERVSTQAILKVLARQDVDRDMFADPQQEYAQAVQFYQHDVDWANRMILGDSLHVMASLTRREDLAGKVQMIYLDPPYGIKFSSNFQPQLGQRDVKDREQDLTREPEMVKAYRDTWTLGVHSYLAYLRDRLAIGKELLTDTGSIFVQIGDENLHRVKQLMDEVFGIENFVSIIAFVKTSGFSSDRLDNVADYLIWYARDREHMKFRQLFSEKEIGGQGTRGYSYVELPNGMRRRLTAIEFESGQLPRGGELFKAGGMDSQGATSSPSDFSFEGKVLSPGQSSHWKTSVEGMERLRRAEKLILAGNTLSFVRYAHNFPVFPINNVWIDTGIAGYGDPKIYVVQTNTKVIERCILMSTDPGDLVLDPTCGSGTTAYVAEEWGRRWITIDSSRVALALAKHRLLTASFAFYQLRELNPEDVSRNPDGSWIAEFHDQGQTTGRKLTFQCKAVPHITLKSIARNTSLDPIFEKHEPILAKKLETLNREVRRADAALKERLVEKLFAKHREEGGRAVTDADRRRWLLPDTQPGLIKAVPARKPLKGVTARQAQDYRDAIPKDGWKDWQVPFDTDPDWPPSLQQTLKDYRRAWREKMDEVNACIAANAETEELVDKPELVKGLTRVSGPFTVEGVIAMEKSLDTPIGGAPDALETFGDDPGTEVANAEAHLDKIVRLLKASGVDFQGNRNMTFSDLQPVTGPSLIHAEGTWRNGDQQERRVAVSVGPEVGNLSTMQVEDAVRSANRRGYDDVVFAAFGFDAAAQDAIENSSHPKLRLHMALIRPDVAMGDLLKSQPGSQLFTVFSAPRVSVPHKQPDGFYTIEMEGMDVYDPVANALYPTDRDRIAAWFLDSDYDSRTFCICQAFFPDASKWEKLARALGDKGVVEPEKFAALSGFTSLPFPRPARLKPGETWRIAVKAIDPRGNEGMRVLEIR